MIPTTNTMRSHFAPAPYHALLGCLLSLTIVFQAWRLTLHTNYDHDFNIVFFFLLISFFTLHSSCDDCVWRVPKTKISNVLCKQAHPDLVFVEKWWYRSGSQKYICFIHLGLLKMDPHDRIFATENKIAGAVIFWRKMLKKNWMKSVK